ncbi:unnamed protein product, partial [Mesorhabditis belari]|uniref:C-type lectin domain-containing protein n=1 Tax=Mesorhabditis belari TaxID=2138241 RepID=A0AAF3EBL7_9BILA
MQSTCLFTCLSFITIYFSATYAKCPEGSLEYLERAECIYPVDSKTTYPEAKKICRNLGGQIITIRDIFENVMSGSEAQTTCPAGWVPFNGKCYYFQDPVLEDHFVSFTIYGAEDACQSMGATVVSIHSQEEFDFLKREIATDPSILKETDCQQDQAVIGLICAGFYQAWTDNTPFDFDKTKNCTAGTNTYGVGLFGTTTATLAIYVIFHCRHLSGPFRHILLFDIVNWGSVNLVSILWTPLVIFGDITNAFVVELDYISTGLVYSFCTVAFVVRVLLSVNRLLASLGNTKLLNQFCASLNACMLGAYILLMAFWGVQLIPGCRGTFITSALIYSNEPGDCATTLLFITQDGALLLFTAYFVIVAAANPSPTLAFMTFTIGWQMFAGGYNFLYFAFNYQFMEKTKSSSQAFVTLVTAVA